MSVQTVDRWSTTPAHAGRHPHTLTPRVRRLRSVPTPRPAGDLSPARRDAAVGAATTTVLPDPAAVELAPDLQRLRLLGRSGIDTVAAKLTLMRGRQRHQAAGDPVAHVSTRLKSVESILAKARRKDVPLTPDAIRAQILDVAGVRVVCDVASDLYRVRDLLLAQGDVVLLSERDYLARPKASGYRALHLVVEVPVDVRGRREHVAVEIQLRTVAADAWARLEHRLAYKGDADLPAHVTGSLRRAADVSWTLDSSLELIRAEARTAGLAIG
ncbi:GTP pyrophosphokinase [Cellulomonas fimi]|uniref:GTP pyrophosphokinase n=1 Tax=Cellulomonas fimi TaxID=1708 RepID=UPI0023585682|nr:GTP pyrophosphokinase family protein [Cellulomonas fimi]